MNEERFHLEIRRALDESAGRLPFRVAHRLERARGLALTRLSQADAAARRTVEVREVMAATATAGGGSAASPNGEGTSWWWRFAATVLPLLIVVAGLMAISVWVDTDMAEDTADVDMAVLTDDVPISAYADRGFGVFLKNSQQ